MKRPLFVLLSLLFTIGIYAQSTITHTVQRGETIESVAQKYGVSVYALQQENPDTKEYFYVGMKLTIPPKTKVSTTSTPLPRQQTSSSGLNSSQRDTSFDMYSNSSLDGSDYTSIGLTFGSDFSDLVGMSYGIQGRYFLDNRFGATLGISANYGLEEYADIVVRVGPSYVYPFNDFFYFIGSLCYTLTIAESDYNSGNVSGVSFIPTFGISINKVRIGVNADLRWRNGGNFGAGAFIGVSYAF